MPGNELESQPQAVHAPDTDSTERLLTFLREESAANRTALREDAESNRQAFFGTMKIIAYPLAVVLAIAGFIGFKSARDLMDSIRQEGKRASDAEILRMRGEIRDTLKAQFEGPNIRSIVKDAARESTESSAAPLIKQEVVGQVRAQIQSERPEIHDAVVSETKKGVAEMQPLLDAEKSALKDSLGGFNEPWALLATRLLAGSPPVVSHLTFAGAKTLAARS